MIFLLCVLNFNYNYSYSGGGIFFKFSNFFFENNYLFYFITLISIYLVLPLIINNYFNLLFFLLIIFNNPQYTLYHKYFDPFLLLTFFTVLNLNFNLNKIVYRKNYLYIFSYFVVFLIISNLKYLWKI